MPDEPINIEHVTILTLGIVRQQRQKQPVMFVPVDLSYHRPQLGLWQTAATPARLAQAAITYTHHHCWGYPHGLAAGDFEYLRACKIEGRSQSLYLLQRQLCLRDFPGLVGRGVYALPFAQVQQVVDNDGFTFAATALLKHLPRLVNQSLEKWLQGLASRLPD